MPGYYKVHSAHLASRYRTVGSIGETDRRGWHWTLAVSHTTDLVVVVLPSENSADICARCGRVGRVNALVALHHMIEKTR